MAIVQSLKNIGKILFKLLFQNFLNEKSDGFQISRARVGRNQSSGGTVSRALSPVAEQTALPRVGMNLLAVHHFEIYLLGVVVANWNFI